MTFEECIESIHEGSVIDFKEYSLNRHDKKILSFEIDGGLVQKIMPANTPFSREFLEQYYGNELDSQDYLQLSMMNCPRFVVSLGFNQDNELNIKIITLNKDFYNTGLQELIVTNEMDLSSLNEPNYLMAQKGWI